MGLIGYVGKNCTIEPYVKVGDAAVVHEYARVSFNAIPEIKSHEVVIRTPTSLLLYQQCDRDVSSDEYVPIFFFFFTISSCFYLHSL